MSEIEDLRKSKRFKGRKLNEKIIFESKLAEYLAEQSLAVHDQAENDDDAVTIDDLDTDHNEDAVDKIRNKIATDNALVQGVRQEDDRDVSSSSISNDQFGELMSLFKRCVDQKSSDMAKVEGQLTHEARNVEIVVKEESSILDEIDWLTREAWSHENENSND
uniref:Uncharacterized protein n=1 Tax=Romanomermis culicivorax TaxID=13658 RepID=A0A915KJ40_ROMCU